MSVVAAAGALIDVLESVAMTRAKCLEDLLRQIPLRPECLDTLDRRLDGLATSRKFLGPVGVAFTRAEAGANCGGRTLTGACCTACCTTGRGICRARLLRTSGYDPAMAARWPRSLRLSRRAVGALRLQTRIAPEIRRPHGAA